RPPKTALLRQTAGTFKPTVWCYYQSATQSVTGDVGDESKADGRASLLRSWGLWGLIGIVVVGGVVGVMGVRSFFNTPPVKPPPPAPVATPEPAKAAPSRASRAATSVYSKPEGPVMSLTWRVGGYVIA